MWERPPPLQNHPPGLHFCSCPKEERGPTQNQGERHQHLLGSTHPARLHCTKLSPWVLSPTPQMGLLLSPIPYGQLRLRQAKCLALGQTELVTNGAKTLYYQPRRNPPMWRGVLGAAPAAGNGRAHGELPPRAEAANHRPLPERALGERVPGTSGPGSSTEGDSEAAPGARGHGELVGFSDSENRGPLCRIQSHGRPSSSAFVLRSAYAATSLSLGARGAGSAWSQAPGRARFRAPEAQLYAGGWELHHQHLQCSRARAGGGEGGGKEGVCIREGGGRERLRLPAPHSGQAGSSAWALRVTLGRPPA